MSDPLKQRRNGDPFSPAGPDNEIPCTCFHQDLCDNLSDGVYFVDAKRQITYWNRGAEGLTGFSREEAIGKHCHNNFLMHVDEKGCALCFGGCPLSATLPDGSPREGEIALRHK